MQNNNYNNYNSNFQQKKKHSGAKESIQKVGKNSGKLAITAWNYNKNRGMITLKAFENKGSKRVKSKNNNTFVTLIAEIFYHQTGNHVIETCLYNLQTGKMFVDKLQMVVSTKARNGGYFGKISK